MPTKTHSGMDSERVAELIEAYGSNTQSWPESERAAAVECLESSAPLQKLMEEEKQLDMALLEEHVEQAVDEELLSRIVEHLPAQAVANKVVKQPGKRYQWSASIAAVITGIAITLTIMNAPDQGIEVEPLVLQEMDYWLWQDVTDQVSFDNAEESPTDFMSML